MYSTLFQIHSEYIAKYIRKGGHPPADLAVMGSGVAHDVFLLSYPKDPAGETGYIGKRFFEANLCWLGTFALFRDFRVPGGKAGFLGG